LIIGIDEHSFRGQRMATTITDISNHSLLAVLKDHRKQTIRVFLRSIPPEIKEKLREMYRANNRRQGERILDSVIAAMRVSEDGEILCWRNMLRRWKEYILNYFDNRTTNAYTEGVQTKIKKIKRVSYGFRKVEVYVRKIVLFFVPIALLPISSHFLL